MSTMTEGAMAGPPGGPGSRTLATLRDTAATLERVRAGALRRGDEVAVAHLEERLLLLRDRIAGIEARASTAPRPRPIAPSFTHPTRTRAQVAR